jgi:hypothetical protein
MGELSRRRSEIIRPVKTQCVIRRFDHSDSVINPLPGNG